MSISAWNVARGILEQTITNAWQAIPGVQANTVAWDEVPFTPTAEMGQWLQVYFLPGRTMPLTVGGGPGAANLSVGVIHLNFFFQHGQGIGAITAMIDAMRDVVNRVKIGGVQLYAPSLPVRVTHDETQAWAQRAVTIPFQYDEAIAAVASSFFAPPSSLLATTVTALGGRVLPSSSATGVAVAYWADYNIAQTSGKLTSIGDAFGNGAGFGVTLFPVAGGNSPAFIGYDTQNNLILFSAANQTVLSGALDPLLNIGALANNPWWFAFIGTCESQSYVALATNSGDTNYLGIAGGPSAHGVVWCASSGFGTSSDANSLVPVSATRRCVIAQFYPGVTHSIEVRAQAVVSGGSEGTYAAEPYALFVGGFNGSQTPAWFSGDMHGLLAGPGTLSTSQRAAIETLATTFDGTHNNISVDA